MGTIFSSEQQQQQELNQLLIDAARKNENLSSQDIHSLLSLGVEIDGRDSKGWTALMYAAQNGNLETVKTLIEEHQADVNALSHDGGTALMCAAINGKSCVVDLLLKHEANVNVATDTGWTALMGATKKDHYFIAKTLLEHGADANAATNQGFTALMFYTVDHGYTTMTQLLLDHGADVNARCKEGYTSLMYATSNGNFNSAELLLDYGADGNAADNKGKTAIQHITRPPNERNPKYILTRMYNAFIRNGVNLFDLSIYSPARLSSTLESIDGNMLLLLATTLPNKSPFHRSVCDKVMEKLPQDYKKQIPALKEQQQNLAEMGLTEDQQRRVIAFKIEGKALRNNATYITAILPEGDSRNKIIKTFNDQNPKQPLDPREVKALSCFAYGTGKISGLKNEQGAIDYQRVGEIIWKLITNDKQFFAPISFATENQFVDPHTIDSSRNSDKIFYDSYTAGKINSYAGVKSDVIPIFHAYNEMQTLKSHIPNPVIPKTHKTTSLKDKSIDHERK